MQSYFESDKTLFFLPDKNVNIFFVFLHPSFNLGFKASKESEAARYAVEVARERYRDLDHTVARESEIAAEKLQLAYKHYNSTRIQTKIAQRSYELARRQYQNGTLSSNRLLEIEINLREAEATAAAAKVGFFIAQSVYFYTVGDERLGKGI